MTPAATSTAYGAKTRLCPAFFGFYAEDAKCFGAAHINEAHQGKPGRYPALNTCTVQPGHRLMFHATSFGKVGAACPV